MNFSKILPYKIKRLIPMTALALAPTITSCDKTPTTPPEPVDTRYDVELGFTPLNTKYFEIDYIQQQIDNPDIRYIYIVPHESVNWPRYTRNNIPALRRSLAERLALSPRVRGRGDFPFKVGEASQVPEDSLWYVQNGWTINKHLQNQK